ncbi:MAG: hypothetical protein UX07_C0012G0014 [Parcubacteria group bacterium GW2011_GWA2_45_30]|nr:MAG: hypothetical protein UX07_C0012G0014 [Parcubacteria group bacterium GW2011_GWA2_45_30]
MESIEKNNDLGSRRHAVLEKKMTELSLAQKRLNFGFGNMEDIEMWDEIEEKRKKESGHERLAA